MKGGILMNIVTIIVVVVVVAALLGAGKIASRTVMNAVRILAVILGVLALLRNWQATAQMLDQIAFKVIPYLFGMALEATDHFVKYVFGHAKDIDFTKIKK